MTYYIYIYIYIYTQYNDYDNIINIVIIRSIIL
jgi:hypothetical protein